MQKPQNPTAMNKTIYLAEGITGKQLQKALGITRKPKTPKTPETVKYTPKKRVISENSFLAQKILKKLNA